MIVTLAKGVVTSSEEGAQETIQSMAQRCVIAGEPVRSSRLTIELTGEATAFVRDVLGLCVTTPFRSAPNDWRERLFLLSNTTLSMGRVSPTLYRLGMMAWRDPCVYQLRRTAALDVASLCHLETIDFIESVSMTLTEGLDATVLDAWLAGGTDVELIRGALLAIFGYPGSNRSVH